MNKTALSVLGILSVLSLMLSACSFIGSNTATPQSVSGVVENNSYKNYKTVNAKSPEDVAVAYFTNWFTPGKEDNFLKMSKLVTGSEDEAVSLSGLANPVKYFDDITAKNKSLLKQLENLDVNSSFYDTEGLTDGEKAILHILSGSFTSQFSAVNIKEVKVDEKKFVVKDGTHITVPLSAVTLTNNEGSKEGVDEGVFNLQLVKKGSGWLIDGKTLVDRVTRGPSDTSASASEAPQS